MARKKDLETVEPAVAPEEQAMAATPARWRVSLACPTRIAHPVLEVEAATEQEARAEFCRRNGISDSMHSWKIERIA